MLYISTGDVVVGKGAIDLYWRGNGGVWCCRSLLGTMLKTMTLYISTEDGVVGYALYISTGDGAVDYRTVDLYWVRSS